MSEVPSDIPAEKPDSFWKRVYAAVIVTTVLVVTLLYVFSKYFSS